MSNAVASTGITVKRAPIANILTSSVANPSIITTATPHGLVSTDPITIVGHVGSTPAINGARVATVIDATHFSIPVNVTVAGAGGSFSRDAFTTVGEVTNVDPGGISRNKIETSTHNDGSESHTLGIIRQDDPTFTINYVGSDATHAILIADIAGNVKARWQIAYPSGTTRTGDARVQRFKFLPAPVDGVQGADLALTWAGPVTEFAA